MIASRVCRRLVNPCCFQLLKSPVSLTQQRNLAIRFEPEYLELLKPQLPVYEPLDIQIKGYDFTVLESYGRYVHRMANTLGIDVEDCWATPCKSMKVTTLKKNTEKKETEYDLKLYERNVKVVNLSGVKAPLFFDIIQAALPQGVQLTVHKHEKEHDEIRYIPDLELIELKKQLQEMVAPPSSTHKKK